MSSIIDIKGKRFGRWTVIEGVRKNGKFRWRCRCDCGNESKLRGWDLTSGHSTRCSDCHTRNATHGQSGTRLYVCWREMRQRCRTKSHHAYKDYGGRGIKVCREWDESFEAFREWALANGYGDDLSIDRINNNGNYEPGNCRWATRKQQHRNKRNNVIVAIQGEVGIIAEMSRKYNIPDSTIRGRYYKGLRGIELIVNA